MTMFTRNDKPADPNTNANGRTSVNETTNSTMPGSADIKRPQAMAQPISSMGSVPATSVISKALKITGQLESTENIQIEGEVDGDIRAVSVKVGSNASVKGTVYGDEVELAGTVEGKIEAKKVVLTRTAHMSGDVIHQDITIESGAFIDGHCRPDFGKAGNKSTQPAAKPVVAAREIAAPEKTNGISAKL